MILVEHRMLLCWSCIIDSYNLSSIWNIWLYRLFICSLDIKLIPVYTKSIFSAAVIDIFTRLQPRRIQHLHALNLSLIYPNLNGLSREELQKYIPRCSTPQRNTHVHIFNCQTFMWSYEHKHKPATATRVCRPYAGRWFERW